MSICCIDVTPHLQKSRQTRSNGFADIHVEVALYPSGVPSRQSPEGVEYASHGQCHESGFCSTSLARNLSERIVAKFTLFKKAVAGSREYGSCAPVYDILLGPPAIGRI
jgi:hypothetical protein